MIILALALFQNTTVTGTVSDGRKTVADAVVWLEGGATPKPTTGKIDQKDMRFVPHVLVVPKGSTVQFPNSDAVYHNVFAEFEAKTFDLGMYPKGQSKSVRFDKPGVVSVLCNIHAEMSAYVVVVDSSYFSKTDKQGRFKIEAPRGSYVARAWHESGKAYKQPLTLSEGATLSITLTKP
jgi:plastocyanin